MPKDKQEQQTSQTVTATSEERELNRLALDRQRVINEPQTGVQLQGLDLISQLLAGGELPGFLQKLPQGISPEVTQGIVDQSLQDIAPQFQQSGILDSGVAAEISARTAGDIRRASEETNLNNLFNLLNLAVGGQAQIQAPILGQSQLLSQRLAGLRSTSGTGSVTSMNPFLKSFSQSAGQTLGSPKFEFGPFSVGGQ